MDTVGVETEVATTTSCCVETNKIVELADCNLATKTLLTGTLLKWMDISACLAAEKQARVPCVTASVDDLQIEKSISASEVINLKARINRVFNTSMEVEVLVTYEELASMERHRVCKAYFTFVTRPDATTGAKNLVPPIEPRTPDEHCQYALANERKKMRLDYRTSLKRMKEKKMSHDETDFETSKIRGSSLSYSEMQQEASSKAHPADEGRRSSFPLIASPTPASPTATTLPVLMETGHQNTPATTAEDEVFVSEIQTTSVQPNGECIIPLSTYCECVEIVLPSHANHNGTTFGGQLMSWMVSTATISARRLCRLQPRLIAVDEVFFKAPSYLGDRIVVKSSVNNTSQRSMEVGVRVEAYAVGGSSRHINSAYLTFAAPDDLGNPRVLPQIVTISKMERTRKARAVARARMRQERRSILAATGPVAGVQLTSMNRRVISYRNILALMELYNNTGWTLTRTISEDDLHLRISQCKRNHVLCFRLEFHLPYPAATVFRVLCDDTKRKHWDMSVTDVQIVQQLSPEENILHYAMSNLRPRENVKGDDFVVLASRREPQDSRDIYTIAYRSVKVDALPPRPEYNRAENRSSGFIMKPLRGGAEGSAMKCEVVYCNQLTDHVFEYLKHDLKGASDSMGQRVKALISLIQSEAQT